MTLDIVGLGNRGEGLACQDGATIAVPLALPGERIVAEVNDHRGIILEITSTSPVRRHPECLHFGSCGGCGVQHLSVEAYREWKCSLLASALEHRGIAGHAIEFIDAHGAGRRRANFHARRRDGDAAVGFMAARSHDLIAIDACPVLAPELANGPAAARAIAGEFIAAEKAFDIQLTAATNGLDCDLRGLRKADRWPDQNLPRLLDQFGVIRLSLGGEPLIATAQPLVQCGTAMVPLPPGGFLQATAAGEQILADAVCERTRHAGNLADLFCGIGPFAIRLAERRPVTAIDNAAPALAALDFAFRHARGLRPVTIRNRDLFREPLTGMELAAFDAVVFDPPRHGADAQARQLAQSAVTTVIAVSCDAATFARDAATLLAGGYRLSETTLVDQFRWSSHVEIAATFTRV